MIRKKEDAMELLDRYLQAIKKHLPRKRQDDILAELRANYEAQLEDKEASLGRPLTQGEAEDWLRQLGSPVAVAGRYLPQQYLIGPCIFPVYWYVLKIAAFWAAIIYTVVCVVTLTLQPHTANDIANAFLRVPAVFFNLAAWITLVFVVLEFVSTRFPQKLPPIAGISQQWSPSSLPPLEKSKSQHDKPRSRAIAVAEVIFNALALGWLLLIPALPILLFGPGVAYFHASPFTLAHQWILFYWCLVGLASLQLLLRIVNLYRGTWQEHHPVQHIVMKALSLIPLGVLLNAPNQVLVLLRNPARDAAQYGATLDSTNRGIHLATQVIVVIVALQLLWDIFQLIRNRMEDQPAV